MRRLRLGRQFLSFVVAVLLEDLVLGQETDADTNSTLQQTTITVIPPTTADDKNGLDTTTTPASEVDATTSPSCSSASNNVTPSYESCKAFMTPPAQLMNASMNVTELALLLALPLTYQGEAVLNPGFYQLASALMAIDHFNERNSAIVLELDSDVLQDCPVHMDYQSLQIMDTGTVESNAMPFIMQSVQAGKPIHAIVGPYNEIPAFELSVVASAMGIPLVSHRALDHNLLLPTKHPMVTQLNPDLYSEMEFLGAYLKHVGRKDYIAVLYASSADSAVQRLEAFKGVANSLNMKHVQAFGYVSPATPVKSRPVQTIEQAVEKLADSGYRTIVWISPYMDADVVRIGKAVHAKGLDQGNHLWVVGAAIELEKPFSSMESVEHEVDPMMQFVEALDDYTDGIEDEQSLIQYVRFMFNAAMLRQAELLVDASSDWMEDSRWMAGDNTSNPYMRAWTQLDTDFFYRVQEINVVTTEEYEQEWRSLVEYLQAWGLRDKNRMKGSSNNMTTSPQRNSNNEATTTTSTTFPPDDLFSNPRAYMSYPSSGSLNLYDTIMAVGIGACKAVMERGDSNSSDSAGSSNNNITGREFQTGIRSSQFHGATGAVLFGGEFPGSRHGNSITYSVFNMYPKASAAAFEDLYRVTDYRNATDGQWYNVQPFIYADGTTSPPALLRDPADQNYLSRSVRIVGFVLAGMVFCVSLASAVWVAVYRHHAVVVASQPMFLVMLCIASGIEAMGIVFMGFDESYGKDEQWLSRACIAVPWLVVWGHIVTYNCLFTKLWRVNRVLQFSRRKVQIWQVMGPALLLEFTAVILLSIWTATTEYGWHRDYIDEATGETMGKCGDKREELGLFIPITLLCIVPTLLTGIMAWKTIDVDATYSESKWIFALMLVHCQVILVGLPVIIILEDQSRDARFLGASLVLWTLPMTTIGLIMFPKMFAVHYPVKAADHHHHSRGASEGVRISGLTTSVEGRSSHLSHDHEGSAALRNAVIVTQH